MIVPTIKTVKLIQTPEEGNTLFPLPADYYTLTADGQRQARVNACCLQYNPDAFVYAWEFFRRTYLFPMPPGTMYGDDLVESPAFHYDIVRSVAQCRWNIWACPRGAAKSTITDEMLLLLALTRPGMSEALILATDTLVEGRVSTLMWCLCNGEELLNDFGTLKPAKGGGGSIWNLHHLRLTNGSHILASSIESKKRGMKPRPEWLALDDPEFDTKASTDNKSLQREFENQLFRVLLPMGQRDVKILWTGTMISKQTSLYNACQGLDPRFRNWNRQILSSIFRDEDGKEQAIWDAHMDLAFLEERKNQIGASAFATEYLNRPGIGESCTFQVDPDYCQYWEEGEFGSNPYSPEVKVTYKVKDKKTGEDKVITMTGKEFMDSLVVIAMTDYAGTISATSDFSSHVIVGFQKGTDILFVLDAWQGKVNDEALISHILDAGLRWRPRVVGIEAISLQKRFYDMAATFFEERADQLGGWRPVMFPIRYKANISKQSRIAGMQWRFNTGRIKLPATRKPERWMKELFRQIEEFNADARDGNLQHDDLIDALSMHQDVSRSRSVHQMTSEGTDKSAIERACDGELIDSRTGLPTLSGVPLENLSKEHVAKLLFNYYTAMDNEQGQSIGSRLDVTSHYTR